MASKLVISFAVFMICQALICGSSANVIQDSARSFKEDFDAATKPIHDAYASVQEQVNSLKQKIEGHPIYKKTHSTFYGKFEEFKNAFARAYDKFTACKHIFQGEPVSQQSEGTGSIVGNKVDDIKQDIGNKFPSIPHIPENSLFPHHNQHNKNNNNNNNNDNNNSQGQQQQQDSHSNQQQDNNGKHSSPSSYFHL